MPTGADISAQLCAWEPPGFLSLSPLPSISSHACGVVFLPKVSRMPSSSPWAPLQGSPWPLILFLNIPSSEPLPELMALTTTLSYWPAFSFSINFFIYSRYLLNAPELQWRVGWNARGT